jgi:predicted acetyltransferase
VITFERIGPDRDAFLRNLYQLYIHDMSEWFGLETGPDGRFEYDTDPLWHDEVVVTLARFSGAPAGFAVVHSGQPWLGREASRDVKDFFVVRRHRRHGVGRALARHLWNDHPAEWLVRVLAANVPAVPFWRATVRELRGPAYEETVVADRGREWIRFRFDNSR